MTNITQIEQLIDNGFIINGPILTLRQINKSSLQDFMKVFSIKTKINIITDNENYNKTMFLLKNPRTGEQKEFITEDQDIINRALKQQRYQAEPIGSQIYALCTALGGKSTKERIFHLDRLIESINGFEQWQFKLTDRIGTFNVTIKIESIDESEIDNTIIRLQFLLDCMALYYQVGFQIQHYYTSPICRIDPTISVGPEERMLQPINEKIIIKISRLISNSMTQKVARGINQSYAENCLPSRLMILWATFEELFRTSPKPLLESAEVDKIIELVSKSETLKDEPKRIEELREVLKNPDRMPSQNRNYRLAESVSEKLGLEFEDTYMKVKKASRLRGKHVHNINSEWDDLIEAENFLRNILIQYMKKEMET